MWGFLSTLFSLFSHAQVVIQPVISGDDRLHILNQEAIDALAAPAEGFWVFNSSTGCINYYLNHRWHELCGTCLPRPGRVEKLLVKRSDNHYILYPTVTGKAEKILLRIEKETQEKSFQTGDSLIISAIQTYPSDSFNIKLSISTDCGEGRPYEIRLKNYFTLRFGPVQTDSVTGLRFRTVGSLQWLVDDYQPSQDFQRPHPERPDVVLLKKIDNPCPKGWRLPSPEDWETLLSPFGHNLKPLFEPASDQNLGLGLSLNNMYSVEEKKIIGEGVAGLYHTSERSRAGATFASPRPSGYLIVSEKAEKVGAGVRCVR